MGCLFHVDRNYVNLGEQDGIFGGECILQVVAKMMVMLYSHEEEFQVVDYLWPPGWGSPGDKLQRQVWKWRGSWSHSCCPQGEI